MPQGEDFWNPYRMIPLREAVDRRPPTTDEKFTGVSGLIHCTLTNLTLFYVGHNRDHPGQFIWREGHPVVPGSSLKGAIRSLAEIVGGGCFVTNPKGRDDRYQRLDDRYKACSQADSLCVTCRMFGMMTRESGARVHKGQVSIGDALIRERDGEIRTKECKILLMKPIPEHTAFYLNPANDRYDWKCRKLYFHQPRVKDVAPAIPPPVMKAMKNNIRTIYALLPGHHFDFEVTFTNLHEEELQLLVYALALEDEVKVEIAAAAHSEAPAEPLQLQGPLRHKIGQGKPLGFGSCQIAINRMTYLPPPGRWFASLQAAAPETYQGESLLGEINRLIQRFVADHSPTMEQLRKTLIWDEHDSREIHWPDKFEWFDVEGNKEKPLKKL